MASEIIHSMFDMFGPFDSSGQFDLLGLYGVFSVPILPHPIMIQHIQFSQFKHHVQICKIAYKVLLYLDCVLALILWYDCCLIVFLCLLLPRQAHLIHPVHLTWLAYLVFQFNHSPDQPDQTIHFTLFIYLYFSLK